MESRLRMNNTPGVGELARKIALPFIQKHYVLSSMYLIGILAAVFANGYSVDSNSAGLYAEKMNYATSRTSPEIDYLSQQLYKAEDLYYRHKGWFSCDAQCTNYYEKVTMLKDKLAVAKATRDSLLLEARQTVGPWSVYGIDSLRSAFWESWEHGKETARRMTMFDAMFIGLGSLTGSGSDRDNSLLATLFQILIQFVMNLTVGLFTSLMVFLFQAWSIIQLYGPSFISGVALFLLVFCAATATVFTAIGGIFGGLAGGIYLSVISAEKRARLDARNRNEHLHYE